MQPVNLMVDTEFLGFSPDAILAQVAIVPFSDNFIPIVEQSEDITIRSDLQLLTGRTSDESVLGFWMKQDQAVIDHVFSGECDPELAAHMIVEYFKTIQSDDQYPILWANGILSDIPILDNFLMQYTKGKHSICEFVKYSNIRDMRSIRKLAQCKSQAEFSLKEPQGSANHNAYDDCIWQIQSLKTAYDILLDLDGE